MRWHTVEVCFVVFLLAAIPVHSQLQSGREIQQPDGTAEDETPIVGSVRFEGLRHIFPGAVAAHICTREGDWLDRKAIERDVRSLARLGWFKSIEVREIRTELPEIGVPQKPRRVALVFVLVEQPFLTKVEYSGSRLLSVQQIEKILEERKLSPGLGRPLDPAALQRVSAAIRSSLNQLGHPEARVRIETSEAPNATAAVRFQIDDGPHWPVRQIHFVGDPKISQKVLRAQMRSITPWSPFSSLRGKDAYTREAFESDRNRLLVYFRNHGFPEARMGNPQVARIDLSSHRWLPWPHRSSRAELLLSVPVQAGPFYRFDSVTISAPLQQQVMNRSNQKSSVAVALNALSFEGKPYSAEDVDKMRRWWQAQLPLKNSMTISASQAAVEARQSFDAQDHTARVNFDLSGASPYIVQRIEFLGLHRFSDRYVRRRIPLREGQPVNDRALEAGFARLARTGYFRQIRKDDIQVRLDDSTRTANISIHLEEIGRQRTTLSGGTSQFGSTIGLAYTVFDLLHGEELLSAQLDGGPESLQIVLGVAKEGVFGTRGSLAFSIFNNVVRPRFAKSPQGPFFNAHSEGMAIPWTYPLTNSDTVGLNYTVSRTATEIPLAPSSAQTGSVAANPETHTSSHALGGGWLRDSGDQRILFSNSVSGGILGGNENMLRSSGEYSRIVRDPMFAPANSWAFRTTFSGAGSYRGDMPFYSRLFPGDNLIRGLRPGELGPDALSARITPSGATISSPTAAGANLVAASNAEYRIPFAPGTQAVGFFDAGSGWLLPNWLGPTKPTLLSQTNGVLHSSIGAEMRWNIPGIQVPVRAYYAMNVARLDRAIHLSGKSIFFARNRFSAFGWGLGPLF